MRWRVVLDSMVWAQAAGNPEGPAGEIVELGREGKLVLVTTDRIRGEVLDALEDDYFRRRLAAGFDAEGWFATTLVSCGEVVDVSGPPVLLDHAKDDPVLWAAAAGDASHLVTREPRLLNLKHYRFTQVATPPAFLREWRQPRVNEAVASWKAMRRASARQP